jgi:hypothetical protein
MMRHTFRGCTLKTMLGLENERVAFGRYRAIRRQERDYLDRGESGKVSLGPLSATDLVS